MQTIGIRVQCEDEQNVAQLAQSLSQKVTEALTEHSSTFGGSSTAPADSYEITYEQPVDRETGEIATSL